MTSRHNPNVSSWVEQDVVESSTKLNFRDEQIRIAYGVEGYLDKELKDSDMYVKVFSRLVLTEQGKKGEVIIPHHRCEPEEFDRFNPV